MTTIRRNFKNIVHNYSDAKVKVREATSNDPWGPSSTLMAEIAEMTYNVMAYTEIMSMIWKRLNDKNKNWRHVYKALVLLDYLVKTGSEKVAQQCKENLFVVQSLRDFQYIEEAKDHGLNVREKAKQLVALLKDDERLRSERAKALLTRERLHQGGAGGGVGGSRGGGGVGGRSATMRADYGASVDLPASPARMASLGGGGGGRPPQQELAEEDIELQLALALSKEEHEQEVRRREADGLKEDMKLRMALDASKREEDERQRKGTPVARQKSGTLVDLIDTSLSAAPANAPDPWAVTAVSGGASGGASDPWSLGTVDPWAASGQPVQQQSASARNGSSSAAGGLTIADPWADGVGGSPQHRQQQLQTTDLRSISNDLWADNSQSSNLQQQQQAAPAAAWPEASRAACSTTNGGGGKSAQAGARGFLGEHGDLVNLDSLVAATKSGGTNPFAAASSSNPFFSVSNSQPHQSLSELHHQQHCHQPPAAATEAAAVQVTPGLNPFL